MSVQACPAAGSVAAFSLRHANDRHRLSPESVSLRPGDRTLVCKKETKFSRSLLQNGVLPGGRRRRSAGGRVLVAQITSTASTADASGGTSYEPYPMPETADEMMVQAGGALKRALEAKMGRQAMTLLLPVDQRKFNFLDTEPRDYPCAILEEFRSCRDVMKAVISTAEGDAEEPLFKMIGEKDNQMDPVGLVYSAVKTVAAVVFPIPETLDQIKKLVEVNPNTATVLVNPQWNLTKGQLVSDFGFGPWRKQSEDFIESFVPVYVLRELRIGEASNVVQGDGGVVRILYCYPGKWQVHLMGEWDGVSHLISVTDTMPDYKQLEATVAQARKTIPWKAPPRMMGTEPAPPPNAKEAQARSGPLSDEEIDALEVVFVRRALMSLGLPSSGRASVLRDRLKEAYRKPA